MPVAFAPTAPSAKPPRNAVRYAAAVFVLLTFATYWNSLHVPFFFDDPAAILENPTIRDLGNLSQVLSPPRNGSGVTGRPVVNLSLAINYALSGTNVVGYHVTNIAFHAIAGLLLFGCVRRTLINSPRLTRFKSVAFQFSLCVAALWLLHPLQTESVTCVIQRTELFVSVFYLGTLYAFIRAVEHASRGWSVLAVASCLLGMASKEVMVTAPVVIFLYDRTFLAGSFPAAWKSRRSLHLAFAGTWLLLGLILVSIGGSRGEVAGFNVGATWWSYALKQCEAIILYLQLTLWPHPLNVFHGVDVVTNPLEVWWQILLLTALVVATFHAAWKRPAIGFSGLWFFFILAPSSSVVPLVSQTVSEHRMYLPLAAALGLIVAGLFRWMPRRALAVSLCVAVAFGVLSARRNVDYRSELSIWTDTVAKAPENARARVNLGAALKNAGDSSAALQQYEMALRLDPNSAEALNNLGTIHLEGGRPADAIEPCRAALRLRPNFSLAHNNLGTALVQAGRVAEGIEHLNTALRLNPGMAEAHCNLSSAVLGLGQVGQAIAHAREAIRLKPNLALAHFHLSSALLKKNQFEPARSALQEAIRIRPDYAEAHSNLGTLYYSAGDPARAVPHYEAALRAKPDYLDARNNLASALAQVGRAEEAIEQYRSVLRLQPGYAEAYFNLGLVLSRVGRNAEATAAYAEALRLRPGDERAKRELARLNAAGDAGR